MASAKCAEQGIEGRPSLVIAANEIPCWFVNPEVFMNCLGMT